jgi:hypothetical protein
MDSAIVVGVILMIHSFVISDTLILVIYFRPVILYRTG